jgi:1-phosphofructokinase
MTATSSTQGAPVVTVTPNPSLDHTVEVDVLERGEVQRTSHALVEAGGKGVNVARALAKHGHPTTAILPAGDDAQRMIGLLTPQQVTTVAVPIDGAIRTNIAVVERDGTTTKLNEPGATLSDADVDALLAAVDEQSPYHKASYRGLPGLVHRLVRSTMNRANG